MFPKSCRTTSEVTKQHLLGTQVSPRACSLPENTIIHLMGNLLPSGHRELDLCCARRPHELSGWHQLGAATAWHCWRQIKGASELSDGSPQSAHQAFQHDSLLCHTDVGQIRVGGWPKFHSALSRAGSSSSLPWKASLCCQMSLCNPPG